MWWKTTVRVMMMSSQGGDSCKRFFNEGGEQEMTGIQVSILFVIVFIILIIAFILIILIIAFIIIIVFILVIIIILKTMLRVVTKRK